jgi:phage tail-like protein
MAEFDAPLGNFRFEVSFHDSAGGTRRRVAEGGFAECTGLEATMEPRAIKEGGHNYGLHQRAGATTFATVVLRRGITRNGDLWKWFSQIAETGGYAFRLDVSICHLQLDGTPLRTWQLTRALAVKFKSADFNARGGEIAVEELHLVHEGLSLADS